MPPRTSQDFDDWFRRSGGDPWGYDSPIVGERFDRSLAFIGEHVATDYSGSFVEMGAFKGQFTTRLARRFPRASVLAVDISPYAVEEARRAVSNCRNVEVLCADFAHFSPGAALPRPVHLLVMECLYYLPKTEWVTTLHRAAQRLGRPGIFISSPVTGQTYPRPRELNALFREIGYALVAARTVSHRWRYVFKCRFRRPNQVMRLFEPR